MTKLRLTIQKIKILEFLRSVKSHPSAEMVYEAVKKDIPTISLGTVYRNLNYLSDSGEILRLEINSEYRFDGHVDKHQHCYCSSCGKLVDVYNKKINDYAIKNIGEENFKVDSVQVLFKGICSDCNLGGKIK